MLNGFCAVGRRCGECGHAVIRKQGNKYKVLSEKGKSLGEYDSREEAKHRLQQVEFFKRRKKVGK